MKNNLILEDINYISARRVHELFGYTSDYVGQLCRSGRLECKMIGRSWFVTEKSIIDHKSNVHELLKSKTKEKRREAQRAYREAYSATVQKEMELEVTKIPTPTSFVEVTVVEPVIEKIEHPVSFVPRTFALPYYISEEYLLAPASYGKEVQTFSSPFLKISFAAGIFAVSFFFMFQSLLFPNINSLKNISVSSSASLIFASQEIVGKIVSFFTVIPKFAMDTFGNIFNKKSDMVVVTEKSSPNFNGLAVVPSTNSEEKDEIVKQKIRDSFSDEIRIVPDESGTAGVITPVFRKAQGDDFVYVLVPINN